MTDDAMHMYKRTLGLIRIDVPWKRSRPLTNFELEGESVCFHVYQFLVTVFTLVSKRLYHNFFFKFSKRHS
jgi:hypothetical protein